MARPEKKEQIALAEWLDWHDITWTHVGHEGKRHPKYAADLKRQGLKAGIPDCLVFESPPASSKHVGVAIELKRRDGVPSDVTESQERWLRWLEENGWYVEVCYGADDAIETLEELGF